MNARDTRPPQTLMPEHLLPIADRVFAAVRKLIADVGAEVLAVEDGRSPAELRNDARGMQAQAAAWAALHFAVALAEEQPKEWVLTAATLAFDDVISRIRQSADYLEIALSRREATVQ